MKKSAITLVAILLCGVFTAKAQTDSLQQASVQAKSEAIAHRLKQELSLSEKQAQQVIQLAKERFSNLQSEDPMQRASAQKQSTQKLSTILTKDQYSKYLLLKKENKKQKDQYLKDHPNYKFSAEDNALDL